MHEAGHNATYLLDSVTEDSQIPDVWDSGAVAAANAAIERTRLKGGFQKEWERLNEGFEDEDLSSEYDESRLQDPKVAPPKGFMSYYGGHSVEEDIAEVESWLAFLPFYENFKLSDISTLDIGYFPDLQPAFELKTACEKLSATRGVGIPGDLASVYTKANLLVDLGMVKEEDMKACIGQGTVGLKRVDRGSGKGFQVFDGNDWSILNEYDQGLTMLRKEDSVKILAKNVITRDGKEYPAILELILRIENDGYPRGLYAIKKCEAFLYSALRMLIPDSDAAFSLYVEGVRSNSFCAFTALVLVSRARRGLIEGAVVLQRLVKFSVPPVPEKPEPPIQYTFVVK
jgi:hypothetical protein